MFDIQILMKWFWACGILEFCYLFRSRQAYVFPVFLCVYYLSGGPMSFIKGFISKLILNGRDVQVIRNGWGRISCTEPSYHVISTRATTLSAGLWFRNSKYFGGGVISPTFNSQPEVPGTTICLAPILWLTRHAWYYKKLWLSPA
jgi:hypothetical protein